MACFAPEDSAGKAAKEAGWPGHRALSRPRPRHACPRGLRRWASQRTSRPAYCSPKMIEGGLHYGLGSTLAVSREALDKIGGLLPLVDHLADDYELGARVSRAGYASRSAPKWSRPPFPPTAGAASSITSCAGPARSADARPWGYAGLIFTHGLGWALLNVLASGAEPG
jgi:ceramide glucosyltransferase